MYKEEANIILILFSMEVKLLNKNDNNNKDNIIIIIIIKKITLSTPNNMQKYSIILSTRSYYKRDRQDGSSVPTNTLTLNDQSNVKTRTKSKNINYVGKIVIYKIKFSQKLTSIKNIQGEIPSY